MKKYDAIVIGAGIGGLGAGIMLAHKGKKVLMLEQNAHSGGRLMSYERDGFMVDLGVHIISQSEKGPLGKVMERVGLPLNINFKKLRPITSFKGETFIFPHDLVKMCPKEDYEATLKALKDIRQFTEDEVAGFDNITTKEFFSKYTKDKIVLACIFNISTIYMCLPSWESSAGEFMRCLRAEAASKASGYPEGGCGKIIKTYEDAFKHFGGEIRHKARVTKINAENGIAKGVYVDGEYIEAEMIVSNADIKQTFLKFVDASAVPPQYREYVESLTYSWTGPILRIALDKVMTDIPMLTQFGTVDSEEYYEQLAKGIVPEELNFFMVSPSNLSPGVAPEGKQLINCGPAMPITTPLSLKEEIREAYYRTLEKYIPGVREHVIWEEYLYFDSLAKLVGEQGAGIGIGQTTAQSGAKRPGIKTPVENLYIVGAEAGGYGVGIELALNSAIEFIDKYCD